MTGTVVGVILVLVVAAFIPAFIADNKGRDFWGYWFFALAFFVPALIVAMLVEPVTDASLPSRRLVPPGSDGKLEPALGMGSGNRRCTNLRCDAAGLRTSLTKCSVCGELLVDIPTHVRSTPRSVGVTGACDNKSCDAAGLPTTNASCEVCGRDITQAFAT